MTRRKFYRVVSGTMRVLTWASGHRQAVRRARRYRNWRALGLLTKFQYRRKSGNWTPWFYIATDETDAQEGER